MDNVKWITKNGVHVPITNNYMNEKIKNGVNKKVKDKTFYHTSNSNFNEFDNSKPRQAILGGQYGYGHYFFDDKELSDDYGAYSKYQYEANVNVDKWFEAPEKEFRNKLDKLGYDYKKDDIANFLQNKGYGGSIIEHVNNAGNKWYEYVVYDGKNIEITKKRTLN